MNLKKKIKTGFGDGVRKGWSGFLWMLKILVPVSFGVMLMDYSGVLTWFDFLLEPVMGWINLPAVAALPLLIGMLTGIYAGIAAVSVLPFTTEQMTVMAVFMLISHFFIQEGVVQAKSGLHPVLAVVCRLLASIATAIVVSRLIGAEPSVPADSWMAGETGSRLFLPVLEMWWWSTVLLSLKMLLIITALMILLELMKQLDLIRYLIRPLKPVLKLLGLSPQMGMLWLTAAIFGIAYGAAVIVEEAGEGGYTREELTRLQLSIGINHAMIEDPLLFLSLGLNPFWLWVPRLLAAMIAVHLYRLITALVRSTSFKRAN